MNLRLRARLPNPFVEIPEKSDLPAKPLSEPQKIEVKRLQPVEKKPLAQVKPAAPPAPAKPVPCLPNTTR